MKGKRMYPEKRANLNATAFEKTIFYIDLNTGPRAAAKFNRISLTYLINQYNYRMKDKRVKEIPHFRVRPPSTMETR
jgi:hypothetical protein